LILVFMIGFSGVAAASDWKVTQLSGPGSIMSSAELRPAISCNGDTCKLGDTLPFRSEGDPAPNGLPDGKIVESTKYNDIIQAWYILPTRRYGHGILGDGIEAGGFTVKTSSGKILTLELPEDQVFEDRIPRLADLNGDGNAEIVTILSSVSKGASIAVYGIINGKLVLHTKTPFIGLTNRWLNIAGFADFNGDGKLDIAGVWTPHIGGTLKFWTLVDGELQLIDEMEGFSNHYIDSPEQRLSAIGDVDGNGTPDLAVPSSNRASLRIIGFVNGRLEQIADVRMQDRIDKAIALQGSGKNMGLADGSVVAVRR